MKNLFYITLLFTGISFGQNVDNSTRLGNNFDGIDSNYLSGAWIKNPVRSGVEGSVYLYNNWNTVGIITTKDDKNLSIKGLNYDTSNEVIVAKISADSVYMFNNGNIKEVRINNKRFKMYPIESRLCYFEVLALGDGIEVLKRNVKEVKRGILNPLTQVASPDTYINKSTFYFKKDNRIKETKLKKKAFCKIFGENSKAISQFISDKNISLKDEKKLQTILNYNNTL